jgi:excisionase family DNA binding protein
MTKNLLTIKEVARALSCTVSCLHRWRREGRIATVKLGRLVRFDEAELDRIAKDGLGPVARKSR